MPTTSTSGTLAPLPRAPHGVEWPKAGRANPVAGAPGGCLPIAPYLRLDLSAGYLSGGALTITASASAGQDGDELSLWGLLNDGSNAWSQIGRSMRANAADGSFSDLVTVQAAGVFSSFKLQLDKFRLADAERAGSSVSGTVSVVQ